MSRESPSPGAAVPILPVAPPTSVKGRPAHSLHSQPLRGPCRSPQEERPPWRSTPMCQAASWPRLGYHVDSSQPAVGQWVVDSGPQLHPKSVD